MLQTNYTEIIQEGRVTATWKPSGNVERVKKRRRDLKPSSLSPSSSVWWADTLSHPCGRSWRAFLTTLPSEDWEQATVTSCHQQQSFWPSTRVQHKLAKASLEPRKQWVKIIWRLKIALAIYCRFPIEYTPNICLDCCCYCSQCISVCRRKASGIRAGLGSDLAPLLDVEEWQFRKNYTEVWVFKSHWLHDSWFDSRAFIILNITHIFNLSKSRWWLSCVRFVLFCSVFTALV